MKMSKMLKSPDAAAMAKRQGKKKAAPAPLKSMPMKVKGSNVPRKK